MKSDSGEAVDVAIVGGGYSGTMLAAQLARRGLKVALIEGGGRAGRGTAYSTPEEVHLLNVPAGKMSAWADQPDHFAEAVAGDGYQPTDFVPRRRFGQYLRGILDAASAEVVEQQAVRAEPEGDGWAVELADGSRVSAKALALAQGNQPPEPLRVADGISPTLFVNDPWSDEGRAAVQQVAERGGDVLIVGTGLTMVDVVLSLDLAGHRGRIMALSRRGQIPRGHAPHDPVSIKRGEVPHGSVRTLWRWLRRRGAEHGWRGAVDSLRPYSQALWQGFSEAEQRRFLRHARPWWDVHRHRIAPEVAEMLKRLIGEGRLEIVAGRIGRMSEDDGSLSVEISRRGQAFLPTPAREREGEKFALGVNCTGPLGAIRKSGDGVLRGLFADGLARPDRLGMGLEVDERSRVLRYEPSTSSVSTQDERQRLWAVGPLTKGRFWEIVAVPDIRHQVSAVADDIAEELKP
jgi:uncharacterized NAD(P)/FAD-binding protein YdhS